MSNKRRSTACRAPHPLYCFLALAMIFSGRHLLAKQAFDHSLFGAVLKGSVSEAGVNYEALQKEKRVLEAYFEELAELPPEEYATFSREEKLAFWINVYNAMSIRWVLEAYPVHRLQEIPDFWGRKTFVMQSLVSLNEIRDDILRRQFRDERVHCALVFASRSAPRLGAEPYTGSRLDEMLAEDARDFVNDRRKNRIVPGKRKIWLSPLFAEFGSDFVLNYGQASRDTKFTPTEMAVLSFVADFIDSEKLPFLEGGRYKIAYLPRDERLNDLITRATQNS